MTIQSAPFVLVMLFQAHERGTAHFEQGRKLCTTPLQILGPRSGGETAIASISDVFGNSEMRM